MTQYLDMKWIVVAGICIGWLGCKPNANRAINPTGSKLQLVSRDDPSNSFFAEHRVLELRIRLSQSQEHRLREDLRKYVHCDLLEGDSTKFTDVAVKLKGAAGSFRELDDKPAFTFNMNKFEKGQRFHGMQKWHLNNSVQDESYLSEMVCAEICRQAGIPTPRVAHARVWLNDRDLGLYVLKEGFDETFLARHFPNSTGNLYDGGFLQDVDADLEKDAGSGPNDGSDLHALRDASFEPIPDIRWNRIAKELDVDAFLKFMAFELMACHWDGYTLNKNNYRIYFEPNRHKAYFMPHGMDQMFGDAGFPLFEFPEPIVSNAVTQNPAWRQQYREVVRSLLPLFDSAKLNRQLDEWQLPLRQTLQQFGEEAVNAHAERVNELKERIAARCAMLKEQVDSPDPQPQPFDESNRLVVGDWYPVQESEDVALEVEPLDGRDCYAIKAGQSGDCVASWRRKLLLANGRYQLEANVRIADVEPREDEQAAGAGLRISGARREQGLTGSSDWQRLEFAFEVLEPMRAVELVVELRGHRGQMWIDPEIVVVKD